MEGLESTWARTSALMRLTGGDGGEGSCGLLGLDGRRPLRPFRLSVRTTGVQGIAKWRRKKKSHNRIAVAVKVIFKKKKRQKLSGHQREIITLSNVPSLTIPTTMHFWKRQNWHRFLRRLSTGQFLFAKHTYFAFF